MTDDGKLRDTAEAVKGIVEAVPVYQDVVQPAAKQIGQALETVAKTIHIALAPISALVWGYEQIKDFVLKNVAEKLKDVPNKNIITPNPNVAGPALEALRYTGHQEQLREMYANLLATSLDSETARNAHPSFVDIIRNMSPDEAKIIRLFATRRSYPVIDLHAQVKDHPGYRIVVSNFSDIGPNAGCEHAKLCPGYLNNLCRLGLLDIPSGVFLTAPGTYEPLENSPELEAQKDYILKNLQGSISFEHKMVAITDFGKQFVNSCVIEKGTSLRNLMTG